MYCCLAAAAVRHWLFIHEISEEAIQDEDIQMFARRVVPEVDEPLEHRARVIPPTPVELSSPTTTKIHEANLQELREAIAHLEELDDISFIPRLLTG